MLCDKEGEILYHDQADHSFPSPKRWAWYKCTNQDCGLLWIDPKPRLEEFSQIYENGYYTHIPPERSVWDGMLDALKNSRIGTHIGCNNLRNIPKGKLLDIGCGHGVYLNRMKNYGWDVQGIDPDGVAIRLANELYNLPVIQGVLEDSDIPDNSCDVVTINHVIEHIKNPFSFLKECKRVIRPLGFLVLTCPNSESLAHLLFKDTWQALDTPRHLYLYNIKNLYILAESVGFEICSLRTTIHLARDIFINSRMIQRSGNLLHVTRIPKRCTAEAMLFVLAEYISLFFKINLGEEIIMTLRVKE